MPRSSVARGVAALGLFVFSLGLAGCGSGGQKPQKLPEAGIVTIKPEDVTLTTELAGRTNASEISEVRPQVSGIITQRLFEEGSFVHAGQPLYRIDPSLYRAAAEQAAANVGTASATLSANRQKAERYTQLIKIDGVSQQEVDDARAAFRQSEAQVAASRAALDAARTNLAYTTVTAPISGRVGRSSVTKGALVTASQAEPLAKIQKLDPIYVDLTQSGDDYLALRRAFADGGISPSLAEVRLTFNDGSTYPLTGHIAFTDVDVDETTGTVTLRATFPNPKGMLLPGMYVRAVVTQGIKHGAILVPQGGISRDPAGNATALVVGAGNKAESRTLTTTRAIGNRWMVTAGLKPGDKLIIEGQQAITAGQKVKPVPASATAIAPH
jgi:membrane fusion protein (multidrug efflux system)